MLDRIGDADRSLTAATRERAFGLLAMSLASLTPLFIVFFIFQKRLIEGIAASGLKG